MPRARPLLLVVDDEPGVLALVRRFAEAERFEVITCADGREAIALAERRAPDLVLVDLRMPEVNGLEVVRAIREADPQAHVVLMTGHASIDTAVEAIKLGAADYLTKPFEPGRLKEVLEAVREKVRRQQRLIEAEGELARSFEFHGMIGRSPAMQDVFDLVRRLAPHARIALVTGETGTGKELVARALHRLGPRRDRRFVTVNCSAVVETLFESELFGHVRGAFTGAVDAKAGLFEAADGGTLFLDEVGELPLAVQAKLLRVLETGEVLRVGSLEPRRVDVRVVAATNRDLDREVAAGRFRSDLLYRLNVAEIRLPPLRERRGDIPYLTAAFLREFAERFRKPLAGLTPEAERLLQAHEWPGNVRELRNVLERAAMLARGPIITDRELAGPLRGQPPAAGPEPAPAGRRTDVLSHVEREHLLRALEQAGGNKASAARQLGLSRRALYRRLARHGLARPDRRVQE
ncbi:MAG TPA: sigma-54 dependent transcriptional regulator [Vicinamibacterales bacterium]|nr:sigma-54 dependent transcriptional regulator [Vicinamibacterales bacterium]